MTFQAITVLGLGKVGGLAARLLHASGLQVTGVDTRKVRARYPFDVRQADLGSGDEMEAILAGSGAVLSCLPYHLNTEVAKAAHGLGMHYFDLTEDVPTTKVDHREMSESAKGVMAPQCGLAPGLDRHRMRRPRLAEQFET